MSKHTEGDYWGRWDLKSITDETRKAIESVGGKCPDKVVANKIYEVWMQAVDVPGEFPDVVWLSIKRFDRRAIHDWRELQRIKNELCGPEFEAVEIYPAESRKVDTSNQFHLWVLSKGVRLPFGYGSRMVVDEKTARAGEVRRGHSPKKLTQRPFGPTHEPADDVAIDDSIECPSCHTVGQVEVHTPKRGDRNAVCFACNHQFIPTGKEG